MILANMNTADKNRTGRFPAENISPAMRVTDIFTWAANPCLHVLTGQVTAHKICTKNYECYHCAYDQWLIDQIEFSGTGQ